MSIVICNICGKQHKGDFETCTSCATKEQQMSIEIGSKLTKDVGGNDMEKALKILKEIRNIENEYDRLKKHRFDKAISELEEAMKPKTCNGCKHLYGVICKHDRGLYCVRQFEADYFVKDNK